MIRLTALLTTALLLGGCGIFGNVFREKVPDMDTARAQYDYASGLVDMAEPLPQDESLNPWHSDGDNNPYNTGAALQYSDRDYARFIRAFEKVIDRFPDDQEFTPNAKVRLGEFHYLTGDYGMAVSYFRDVMRSYPENDLLMAVSLFGVGRVRMAQNQYADAQIQFTRLIRGYGNSDNVQILQLCERARFRLLQLQGALSR